MGVWSESPIFEGSVVHLTKHSFVFSVHHTLSGRVQFPPFFCWSVGKPLGSAIVMWKSAISWISISAFARAGLVNSWLLKSPNQTMWSLTEGKMLLMSLAMV